MPLLGICVFQSPGANAASNTPATCDAAVSLAPGANSLNFGGIMDTGGIGGTVTIDPNPKGVGVTYSGVSDWPIGAAIPAPTAGEFGITISIGGNCNFPLFITVTDPIVLTNTSDSTTMTISPVTTYQANGDTYKPKESILYVGGQLNVSAGQSPGNYQGTVMVTYGFQ